MQEIKNIENSEQKSLICEEVLQALPEWFEVKSAVLEYIEKVKGTLFFVLFDGGAARGFISVVDVNDEDSEIYVMGIKPELHRQGIGTKLLNTVKRELIARGKRNLLVKTLSDKRPDEQYDKTKKFYLKAGFVPLCELDIWGPENPCLLMILNLQ